jgi:hypothetical protein
VLGEERVRGEVEHGAPDLYAKSPSAGGALRCIIALVIARAIACAACFVSVIIIFCSSLVQGSGPPILSLSFLMSMVAPRSEWVNSGVKRNFLRLLAAIKSAILAP